MERSEFDYFRGDANNVAMKKYFAYLLGNGAEPFVRKIYSEYQQEGSPIDRKKWLDERLKNAFKYLNTPPEWIGEPNWVFFKGEPMVFLHQFKIMTPHKPVVFPLGDTIFVFGSKNPPIPRSSESYQVVYKLLIQDDEGCNECFTQNIVGYFDKQFSEE